MARTLSRLIAELRGAPSAKDGEDAIALLSVRFGRSDAALVALVGSAISVGDDVAQIGGPDDRGGERGRPLTELGERQVAVVSIERDVYKRVPTTEGRVRLLETARRAARTAVVVHVTMTDDRSHLGRIAIDAPRAILRAAGVRAAEPGDRFGPQGYRHDFFDEEALVGEVSRAGLAVAKRSGFMFVLQPAPPDFEPREHADSFASELTRVVPMVREVDRRRTKDTPQRILAAMRARGAHRKERGPIGRARLRRAIGWVDALLPGGANCYRRILLEVALDAGAARETVVFGLDVGSTGHVAFENREERAFDVSFAIPTDTTRP